MASPYKPLLISRKAFAHKMGIPYVNMPAWERAGSLPTPIKIGKSIYYRTIDTDAYIAKMFTNEELQRA